MRRVDQHLQPIFYPIALKVRMKIRPAGAISQFTRKIAPPVTLLVL
jgi:retron-type reverse transcriptase